MASNPNFLLTPQQQELLFAALNANRPAAAASGLTLAPSSLTEAPTTKPADVTQGIPDSSYLDYDYSFDGADDSLDFTLNSEDQSNYLDGNGDTASNDDAKTESAPSNADNDSPDKRGHPDDDDDDLGSAKRREGSEKVPKKPGRKPLTSEPSSKRKAQNRAAQRAFRERKEKHLKDLETKVAELEKASEAANSENGLLRSQIEKMSVELNEYKKRVSLMTRSRSTYPQGGHQLFGNPIFNNINDVNFQFEFPKFGQLSDPASQSGASPSAASSSKRTPSFDTSLQSPNEGKGSNTTATSIQGSPADSTRDGLQKMNKDDLSKLSSVFSPALSNAPSAPRTSMDSASTSSPSSSSHSASTSNSSCGTSPEPFTQSPMGFKPVDTMTTIGEEHPTMFANTNSGQDFSQFANVDINDMSWLGATQNSFRFDPQLFGDYREPQENILSSGGFDDSFFNDALDVDFTTPFNVAPSPIVQKSSLISQIDAAKDGEVSSPTLHSLPPVPKTSSGALLTCNKIWERLQDCPKVQNGDFDLDGLCADLQKKAKCSGTGAVVEEQDFHAVMNKYLGKDGQCASKLTTGVMAKAEAL